MKRLIAEQSNDPKGFEKVYNLINGEIRDKWREVAQGIHEYIDLLKQVEPINKQVYNDLGLKNIADNLNNYGKQFTNLQKNVMQTINNTIKERF